MAGWKAVCNSPRSTAVAYTAAAFWLIVMTLT